MADLQLISERIKVNNTPPAQLIQTNSFRSEIVGESKDQTA